MAIQITSANTNVIRYGARVAVRNSSGTPYVIVQDRNDSGIEVWKGNSTDPSSFTEQDTSNNPQAGTDLYGSASAAIDSNDIIHIIYQYDNGKSSELRYVTFNADGTTDTFSGDTTVIADIGDDPTSVLNLYTGIAVDSSDIPHIAYMEVTVDMGSSFWGVFYNNRIGGSWNASSIEVEGFSSSQRVGYPDIAIDSDNKPCISYWNFSGGSDGITRAAIGDANDAASFTLVTLDSADGGSLVDHRYTGMAIDSNGDHHVAYVGMEAAGSANIVEIRKHIKANAWSSWETVEIVDDTPTLEPSYITLSIDGTDRYIFCVEVATDDVVYYADTGSGWGTQQTLETGTYEGARAKWAYNVNSGSDGTDYGGVSGIPEIDYVFEDSGNDIFWNKVVLAVAPTNINISDSITVTESVTVEVVGAVVHEINIFDSITVTEDVTPLIPILNIDTFDSITVTEDVTPLIPILNIDTFDSITVTEDVTSLIPILNIDTFDSITVTEDVTPLIPILNIDTFDSITVTEDVTSLITALNINIFDSITVTESVTPLIPILNIDTFDSITVTEFEKVVSNININVFDLITVTEDVTPLITTLNIDVFDSIIVTEDVTVSVSGVGVLSVDVNDSITVTEVVTSLIPILNIDVNDSITVTEDVTSLIPILNIDVNDSITVTEDVTPLITQLFIGVNDSITVTEDVTPLITSLNININDSITVTEDVTAAKVSVDVLNIDVFDSITVDESVGVLIPQLRVEVFDSITAVDAVNTLIDKLVIDISDSITVDESVSVSVQIPGMILTGDRRIFTLDTDRRKFTLDTDRHISVLDTDRRTFTSDTDRHAFTSDTDRRTFTLDTNRRIFTVDIDRRIFALDVDRHAFTLDEGRRTFTLDTSRRIFIVDTQRREFILS